MVVMQRKKMRPDNKVHEKHKELEIRKFKKKEKKKMWGPNFNLGPL